MDQDARSISMLKRFERSLRIWIDGRGRGRGRGPWFGAASGEAFHLADAHPAAGNAPGEFDPFLGVGDGKKRATVTCGQPAFLDQVLNHRLELQEAKRIRDRCPIFSRTFGHVFLRETKLVGEALKSPRLFHGVEILALEILDEGHLKREFLGYLANDNGHTRQRGPLGGAPASLAGDQLVAKADSPHDERLDDTACADRTGQLLESLFAKARARLIGARIDEIDIDLEQNVTRCLARSGCQARARRWGWGYCRRCSR